MCTHCDLSTLSPHAFDSFFDGALAEGVCTMVCRHCGAVYSTDILLLTSRGPLQSSLQTGFASAI